MRAYLGIFKWWLSLLVSAVVLTGCGGGSGTTSSITTLSGTAATGLPIVGGNVAVTCAGGNALTATTSNDGAWSVTISGQTLPCAIQVNGGTVNGVANATPYHSIALALGIANITPLTDLIVANLAGNNAPAAWFAGLNAAAIQGINAAALNAALGNVRVALNLADLNNLNPFTAAFQAAAGDPLDNMLEALRTALTNAGSNYAALLAAAANQGFTPPAGFAAAFAAAYAQMPNGNGGGGGGGAGVLTCDTSQFQPNAVHAASAQELASFAGNYTGDIYTDDGAGNFTPSAGTAAFDANGVLTLNGQAKTATSICVDNVAGAYGVVLYVHFADGHVDLFANDTFSGSIDTPAGGGGGAAGSLTLSITISGVAAANVNINGVTKPTTQADFCADMTSNSTTSLNNALGAVGTFTINSCTFNGSVGNVSATLAIVNPIAMNVPYSVVYTYN